MLLANAPGKLVLPFAYGGGKNTIPAASQIGIVAGAASLTDGFPPSTRMPLASGGVPPSGLDMNGILFDVSDVVRWANAGAGYIYDAAFATNVNVGGYPKGARVLRTDGMGYWFNTVDGNIVDPESAGAVAAGWVPDFTYGSSAITMTGSNVTLSQLESGKPIIVISGLLTANLNLIFPNIFGKWLVVNNCTGGFNITCKTAAGTGVVIPAGTEDTIHGDTVNIYSDVVRVITSILSGKNKLLNTNFENPVNQLSYASRVTTLGVYNFDCWYYGSDTKFYQAADYLNLAASYQYTLNWSGTATAEYKFATVRSSGIVADAGAWTAIAKGAQITTPADVISGAKFLWIRWTGVDATLATFDKPQLEKGAIATTYEHKLYRDVVNEVSAYRPVFANPANNIFAIGYTHGTSVATAIFALPVPTRWPVTGHVVVGGTIAFSTPAGVAAIGVTTIYATKTQVNFYTAGGGGIFTTGFGTLLLLTTPVTAVYFTGSEI